MTTLRRTVFIGLGGTGMKSILKAKATMLDNYGIDGQLPPMFTFLGIDTDSNEYEKTTDSQTQGKINLTGRERYSIGVNSPKPYYDLHKKEMSWMPSQNEHCVTTLDQGAGQVRSNGRLAFWFHRGNLKTRLQQALTDVNSAANYSEKWAQFQPLTAGTTGAAKTEVHIIFSLSGGTGSGTFLDVAYLMREIARETNTPVTINGYGVLPGVFDEEIKSLVEKSRIHSNAYGVLRELDYLMSVESDKRRVKMSWMNGETDKTPFDSLVLVDNVNSEHIRYRKMENLTEMLSLALLSSTGQIGQTAASIGDNVKVDTASRVFDVEDKCAWVSAVGCSTIMYDSDNVAKVYELKAQNKLIDNLITSQVDANVLANNWIDVVRIRENNGKDHVIDTLYDMQSITAPVLTKNDFDKHNVVDKINQKMDFYRQGYQVSTNQWVEKVNNFSSSIKEQLIGKEKELCNQSLGLTLAFLKEIHLQISTLFQSEMNHEMLNTWQPAMNTEQANYNAVVEQFKNWLNDGFFHRDSTMNSYINSIKNSYMNYVVAELEATRRSYAIEFYSHLLEFINAEVKKIENAIEQLLSIKNKNEEKIRSIQNHTQSGETSVVIDLATDVVKQLKLDENENILVSGFIAQLPTKNLYDEPASVETYQSSLSAYVKTLPKCDAFSKQTIDDVLNNMSKEEFDQKIICAARYAIPFMNINSQGYTLKELDNLPVGHAEQFYICVPNEKTSRLTQNGYYREVILGADEAKTVSTGLNDRIIIYRQKRPIPANAIATMDFLSEKYRLAEPRISCHIDDVLHKRMDEEDYSFAPKAANQDEVLLAWTIGCILGKIKFDKSYWYQDDTVEIIIGEDDKWVNTQCAYRDQAFNEFAAKPYLIDQYIKAFNDHLDAIGTTAKNALFEDVKNNYFKKYSHCQLTLKTIKSVHGYEDTQKLIAREQKCIEQIIKF